MARRCRSRNRRRQSPTVHRCRYPSRTPLSCSRRKNRFRAAFWADLVTSRVSYLFLIPARWDKIPAVLSALPRIDLALWAATTAVAVVLFCLILARRLELEFPFLTAYLGVNLLQTLAQVVVYETYGFNSRVTYAAVWSSQAVVVVARALATFEFCHALLGRYVGVWALAKRLLLFASAMVLALSVYFGKDGFRYGVMTLEMGSEAFIATLVVGTFVFAKHYGAQMGRNLVFLGLGFGLYSCTKIVDDAILTRFWHSYAGSWNEVAMASFVVVLALWIFAMRASSKVPVPQAELASAD